MPTIAETFSVVKNDWRMPPVVSVHCPGRSCWAAAVSQKGSLRKAQTGSKTKNPTTAPTTSARSA
jgi:hypothetical protein